MLQDLASKSFITDVDKMHDFFELTKEEFLKSYSYITEAEYDATEIFWIWLCIKEKESIYGNRM